MENQQQELWHETLEDALVDVVSALGGWKKIGPWLWPALPVEDAARKLMHCLDRGKPNKLSTDELMKVLARAREEGCHIAAAFISRTTGYAPPIPVDPESELQRLQRDFIKTAGDLKRIGAGIEAAQTRLSIVRSA